MSKTFLRLLLLMGVAILFVLAPQSPTTTSASAQDVVKAYGNWPIDGHCVQQFGASPNRQASSWPCNDQTSGLAIPFGMSVEICEHDGAGGNLGRCRRFPPGVHFVGWDFNDKATSFLVERRMIAYLNSADYPTDWKVGMTLKSTPDGKLKVGFSFGSSGESAVMDYAIDIPPSCTKPGFAELTKTKGASWDGKIENGQFKLKLVAPYKKLLGANNWVGVEMKCQ